MDLLMKSTICRACLEEDITATSIHKHHGNKTYKDMLIGFCKIQIPTDDNYDMLCDKCVSETIRCHNFKIKCEQSDEILQKRARSLVQYRYKEDDFKIDVGSVTLKSEQDDNIFLNAADIKSERDDSSSDNDDKDEVLSLAATFGVKTFPKKKRNKDERLKVKSKREKNKPVGESGDCEVQDDWKKPEKGVNKRGRKRKKAMKEDNRLTDDGFKKIYECPKCLHFCKSYTMMVRHFSDYHRINLENHQHYEDIVGMSKEREKSLYDEQNNIDRETVRNSENIASNNGSESLENKLIESENNSNNISIDVDHKMERNDLSVEGDSCSDKNNRLSPADRMKLYKCLSCDYTNKVFDQMKSHILKNHKPEKYIRCEDCNFRCSNVRHLRSHVCIYSGNITHPYQCELCGHATTSKTLLRTHHASKHSQSRPYACHLCHFTTKLRTGLTQHIQRRHEKRKNFACPKCDKKFFSSYHMKIHALTHGGDKQHVCEHCGARFIQKSNLLKHVEVMHSSKSTLRPHACMWCNYRARVPQTLAKHLMTHTGQKPNVCHLCPFTCISSTSLQLHILRHKGDKKFSCSACSYKCYSRDRLRAHERVHSGERPFACTQCPYRAKTKERLKNHNKSHQNDHKFHCENCPYTANYRSNLIQHIKKNCGRAGRRYNAPQQGISSTPQDVAPSSEILSATQTTENNVLKLNHGGVPQINRELK